MKYIKEKRRRRRSAQTTCNPQPTNPSEYSSFSHAQAYTLQQAMDILRLPPPLRLSLLNSTHIRRTLLPSTSQKRTLTLSVPTTPIPINPEEIEPELEPSSDPFNNLLTLTPTTLNTYTTTSPPTPSNLRTASTYFARSPKPEILFTTPYFRAFPASPFPEVTFLGRSNVGKSSLLNALFGRPSQNIAHVSKRPGKTRTMNAFGVGGAGLLGAQAKKAQQGQQQGKNVTLGKHESRWKRWAPQNSLVVVDMPGYGQGSRESWGVEILKYLRQRKQLRRTYVLIDSEHGFKRLDLELLGELRRSGVPFQIVLSKVDKILYPGAQEPGVEALSRRLGKLREVRERLGREVREMDGMRGAGGGDFLCVSSVKALGRRKSVRIGIEELRWSVLEACGLQDQEEARRKGGKNLLGDLEVLEEEEGVDGGMRDGEVGWKGGERRRQQQQREEVRDALTGHFEEREDGQRSRGGGAIAGRTQTSRARTRRTRMMETKNKKR